MFAVWALFFAAQIVYLIHSALKARSLISTCLKALLDYLMAIYFVFSFNFDFSSAVGSPLLVPSSVASGGLTWVPVDCVFGVNDGDLAVMYSATGLVLTFVWLAIVATLTFARGYLSRAAATRSLLVKAGTAVMVIMVTLHPIISSTSLKILDCLTIEGEAPVLRSDVRVRCGRGRTLAIASLLIFSLGSVILVNLIHLRKGRKADAVKLGDSDQAADPGGADALEDPLLSTVSFVSKSLRPERRLFSSVIFARKTLLLTVAVFSRDSASSSSAFACFVLLFGVLLNALTRPFSRDWPPPPAGSSGFRTLTHAILNKIGPGNIDIMGQLAAIFTLSAGPAFAAGEASQSTRSALAVLVLIPNCLMLAIGVLILTNYASLALDLIARKIQRKSPPPQKRPTVTATDATRLEEIEMS